MITEHGYGSQGRCDVAIPVKPVKMGGKKLQKDTKQMV